MDSGNFNNFPLSQIPSAQEKWKLMETETSNFDSFPSLHSENEVPLVDCVGDPGEKAPWEEPIQLSLRAVLVGLFVGGIMCFSNMYFGLQTGW